MTLRNVPGDGDVNVVQSRIERGAAAMGTDGRIGSVEQIVVERESGQLLSLVIREDASDIEFELPASHVRRATGDHVYLDISRADLASHPEMTTPYHPEQYVPVYHGDIVPPGVASRVASGRERPVIMDVEENAAAIVTSETESFPPPPTDERAGASPPPPSPSAPRPTPAAPMAPLPERGKEGTQERERPPTGWGEAVGTEERPVPTPEVSATPDTTGPLMGGKPSTGGMGAASSVPSSPAPALDTQPTSPHLPPYTTEHPREGQPPASPHAPATGTETSEREGPRASAIRSVPVTTAAVMTPSKPLFAPIPGSEAPHASAPGPAPAPQQGASILEQRQPCAGSRPYVPGLLRNLAKSPEPWIIAAGFGAGTLGGLLLRQRRGSSGGAAAEWVRRGMEGALDQAQDRLLAAPDETRELARRMALRGRWFRRGLLLGGASALLFTPKTGMETRARLRDLLEQWWSSPPPD